MDMPRAMLTLAALGAGCALWYLASIRSSDKSGSRSPNSSTGPHTPTTAKSVPQSDGTSASNQSQHTSTKKPVKGPAHSQGSSSEEKKEDAKKELFVRPPGAVDGRNYRFERASPDMREMLIDFAVKANDIYGKRTADDETARQVFGINPERHFANGGIVEVLKHRGDIVGFIAVAVRDNGNGRPIVVLNHLTVKAGLQRKGYGTRLWYRLLEIGMLQKWQTIEWIADPDAEEFYIKKGGNRVGAVQNLLAPSGSEAPSFEYRFS